MADKKVARSKIIAAKRENAEVEWDHDDPVEFRAHEAMSSLLPLVFNETPKYFKVAHHVAQVVEGVYLKENGAKKKALNDWNNMWDLSGRSHGTAMWLNAAPNLYGDAKNCVTLRDIIGNPFRPITIDRRWLTSTVVDLANAIYDEKAFEKIPLLADALQDSGCNDVEILSHCRGAGPHNRGCWVVDLLTGKE